MVTAFSHSVRVLACSDCGAPLETSVAGGVVRCQYCGARHELVGRDETGDTAAAQQAASTTQSESERIAQLRRQDDAPLLPPPSLQHYLAPGETKLRQERLDEAQNEWLLARQQLERGGAGAAERLFHLTLLIAPLLEDRRERALLETALETLPDARHRQLLRRRLVHRAVLHGDRAAAEAWLSPCNPRATELHMDTAYRVAASYVAIARGDPHQVLTLLGQHADDLPIAEGSDAEAALLRAHALEQRGLGHQAEQALLRACRPPTRFGAVSELIEHNATLRLCAATWPSVRDRLWAVARNELTTASSSHVTLAVVFAVLSAALIIGPLVGNLTIGIDMAGTIVTAIFAVLFAVLAVRKLRQHRDHRALVAQGELAFARAVAVTTHARAQSPSGSPPSTAVKHSITVIIDTSDGPVEGSFTATLTEAPPLGRYPCLHHPDRPASLFELCVGAIEAST